MPLLIATACIVGFLCGATSVGGVLLIPTLDASSDMGLRTVMGTVLLSFFFSGLLGTWIHSRAARINWRMARALCLGCLAFGYPGAVAKEHVSIPALNIMLGAAIVMAGLTSLKPLKGGTATYQGTGTQNAQLFLIGALVAFFSAMTGAGGPVLSVPIMLILGYDPLLAIAIAQPLQMAVTFSGSLGNISVGAINYPMAALLTVLMMLGVALGIYAIRFFKPDILKKLVSLMCVGTGGYMLLKSVLG